MKLRAKFVYMAFALLFANLTIAGTVSGGGGGGIKRDGKYLTFGSARVQIGLVPIRETPGLNLLKTVVMNIPLASYYKGQLQRAIYPVGDRVYYKINTSDLSESTKLELLKSYREVLNNSLDTPDEIAFFGVTAGKETFLLPEFFLLNEIQQAAILFHEALWVINPKLSYAEVVDAEIKMENFIQSNGPNYNTYDQDLFSVFNKVFKNSALGLLAAATDDFNSGRLKPFLNRKNRLPISWIIGENNLACGIVVGNTVGYDVRVRTNHIQSHIANQIAKYPEIKFLKEFFALLPIMSTSFENKIDTIFMRGSDRKNCIRYLHGIPRSASIELWNDTTVFFVPLSSQDKIYLDFNLRSTDDYKEEPF